MPNCIARIFELLLRLLLPAPGRHRSEGAYPYVSMPPRTDRPPVRSRLVRVQMVRGEDTVMVRPYVGYRPTRGAEVAAR
ncbi:hypothetical protein DY245_16895 [Streptomyces inhibens]|uniref:Uncharacterized protein n=1 Tax=Streptomyces inhibens TaxID=2293571 RepID=A0A371Q3H8_STRIH|nr:hypothetical protein [Streptomyces inhibens]REK89222.1 hypothetical protein DY245_16895 [Streptomyces inhibens]